MKRTLGSGLALLLAGCTTFNVDPSLPNNVSLSGPQNGQPLYVESIHFANSNISYKAPLTKCVATVVDNQQFTIADSSASFFSPWGGYHDRTIYREIGGGPTLVYSDDDSVIAHGTVGITSGKGMMRQRRVVAFKLKVQRYKRDVSLDFSHISAASVYSSSVANPGLQPVGAWSSAHPERVYDALAKVSDQIGDCLKGK